VLRRANFRNLWMAETISAFGTETTTLALPLTAVLVLDAAPGQMGFLTAASTLPFLLFGLFIGVWVDRLRRRPLLIAADLIRFVTLLALPAAWALDVLSIWMLYGAALLIGSCTVIYDVAFVAFVPGIVERDRLLEANSRLRASQSVAQVTGPGVAGVLVGLITAPYALLVDAFSYLASAGLIMRVRAAEELPTDHARPVRVRQEISEGLRFVLHNPLLRAAIGFAATTTMFGWLFLTVYVLYMTHDLGLSPLAIGLVFGTGGVGALLGAMVANRLSERFGVGRTMVYGALVMALGGLPIPVAVLVPSIALPLLIVCEVVQWCALTIVGINQVSLRQTITPDHLLGRVSATARFLSTGSVPLGGLLGGLSGELLGVRATLVVGIIGMMAAFLWVFFSPLRGLQSLPEAPDEAVATG
jgi:MFS family permease